MKRPVDIVRKDGTNHHPIWDEKRQRCYTFISTNPSAILLAKAHNFIGFI
jgi:hypothetical protein